jgi:hypothetical protein
MAKYLTLLLVAMLLCGLWVSQRSAAVVATVSAAKPAAKPKPKPNPQVPNPAEEKELLQFMQKHRRDFYNSLMTQKKTNNRRYRGTLKFAWQWYKRYKTLNDAVRSEVNREQKARIEIRKVLGRIKRAKTQADYRKLLAELNRLVAVQFDAQMKISIYKLDQAYNQISRLRKELSNRQAERKKIVDKRVADWMKAVAKPPEAKATDKKK